MVRTKNEPFHMRLPDDMKRKLEELSKISGNSEASIVRSALSKELKK